jgi:hypothetical protein
MVLSGIHGQCCRTIDLWATNNESSRTDTEGMTVAMLSERLRSLCGSSFIPG